MDRVNALSTDLDNTPAPVNSSKLFMRSVARAAINLPLKSKMLEVIPLEEVGYVDGELNDERGKIEAQGVDADGNAFNVVMETSNTIVAEWMPLDSNRVEPPNIRRGERVLLWQFGDTDKYYWTPTGFDDNVRRKETFIFRLSNTDDEADKTITPENSYWFEMSTHRKQITLSTSKSANEPFAYTIQVDADAGRVTICDDANNFIELSSAEKKIILCNGDDTHIVLDKTNLTMNASDTVKITCKNYLVNAKSATITAASTSIEGGVANMGGTYNVLGPMNFKAGVTSNGKDISSSHTHKNSGGKGTGGPVS